MKSFVYLPFILLSFLTIPVFAGGDHSHGNGSSHSHTPHDGIVKPFADSTKLAGYLELKLHDDKGDLELWLNDWRKNKLFNIPLNSEIKVEFPDLNNKVAVLRVRNKNKNEDESGRGNIIKGKTNYFVFPGKTRESAEFLVGKGFSSKVIVSFVVNGELYSSDPFILTPHTH